MRRPRWQLSGRGECLDLEQVDRAARARYGGELAVGNQLADVIGGAAQKPGGFLQGDRLPAVAETFHVGQPQLPEGVRRAMCGEPAQRHEPVNVLDGLAEDSGGLSGRDARIGNHPLLAKERVERLLCELVVLGSHAPKPGIQRPSR
jgi:hypothetical protein